MSEASTAMIGWGTTLGYSGIPATSFVTIAQVEDAGDPKIGVDDVETTHYQSTEQWKEHIPGLKDGGEVSFDINYLPATTALLYSLLAVNKTWMVTKADGSFWEGVGYVKTIDGENPKDGRVSAKCVIRCTGKWYFVANS